MISLNKLVLLSGVLALAACGSDGGTNPSSSDSTTRITVNAASGTTYLLFGSPATISTSANWDLSFSQLTINANGGASGSGNVGVYCASPSCGAPRTDAQVLALTNANGLAMFDSITAASIPTDTTKFVHDAVALAINGWYTYNASTHAVTPNADSVWSVRLASTSGAYATFHVTGITPTGAPPAPVNIAIQWAVQPSGQTTVGSNQTQTVSLISGVTSYVDLTTGTVTAATAPTLWDIAFQYTDAGYNIIVNGTGGAAAVSIGSIVSGGYSAMTSATVFGGQTIPASVFVADGTGGAFASYPWYRYNIDPANPHSVVPTYDVYIVKRGTVYYKVQIISFYGAGGDNTGDAYHLTVRYAPLTH